MQEHPSVKTPWIELAHSSREAESVLPNTSSQGGATFDNSLSDLKKLQDPSKFNKARFSFKLYKRG
jgi:hypothetical protein